MVQERGSRRREPMASGRAAARLGLNGPAAQSALAELIGTYLFALVGSTVSAAFGPFGNGFALAVFVYLTRPVSGGHLNPAVSLGAFVAGKLSLGRMILYIIAQVAGSTLASLTVAGLYKIPFPKAGTSPAAGPGGALDAVGCFAPIVASAASAEAVFGWELLLTFALVAVVFATIILDSETPPALGRSGAAGPLAVGLTLVVAAMAGTGGPSPHGTGAAINPARALGPAFVFKCGLHGGWRPDAIWIFVVAELIGGVLAGLVMTYVLHPRAQTDRIAAAQLQPAGDYRVPAADVALSLEEKYGPAAYAPGPYGGLAYGEQGPRLRKAFGAGRGREEPSGVASDSEGTLEMPGSDTGLAARGAAERQPDFEQSRGAYTVVAPGPQV